MIGRRVLLAGAASVVATAAHGQYFPRGLQVREVRFPGAGDATLAGTLVLPAISEIQRVPGVVLVAGSGPTDRNGNNPLIPVRVDLLKKLAEILGHAGIATLRYDKRGIGGSTIPPRQSVSGLERFFTWDHFVADVQRAHAELLRHDEIKPYATAFLGHSEGGLLSLAASVAMGKSRPYTLVLASTPGRPLADIVRDQIARTLPQLSSTGDRIIDAIRETGQVPGNVPAPFQPIFPSYAGAFLQAAFAFEPAKTLERTDIPCLLLQGGADTQVIPMGDIEPLIDALRARTAPAEIFIAPRVSHNLKTVSAPDDPGFAGPVASSIETKLVEWLHRSLGA
ncbi:MAG: alpha/beta fold hydrolase [Proteobacteria bacterium]|nr:alpha/beta fold hydrolase [Pseudomonadota bacterium]